MEFEDKNVADPKFRNELVHRYRRMATPTIIIDDEIILGFGINRSKIVGKLNLERR